MDVFVVQHVHDMEDGEEDVKMIGVYSSREKAEQAVERLQIQPGFSDLPEGFCIDRYPVDKDHWTEGYVTLYSEVRPEATVQATVQEEVAPVSTTRLAEACVHLDPAEEQAFAEEWLVGEDWLTRGRARG